MDRPRDNRLADRSYVETVDSQDLRSVISAALNAKPVNEDCLRRGVWTYVGAERKAGVRPAQVIVALTELVEQAETASIARHDALMRQVILWCVEAYFGHLGGHIAGRQNDASAEESMLAIA